MSRIFNLIPIDFHDEMRRFELSTDEAFVHLYLLTCRESNPVGAFPIHPETIAFYTGYSPPEIHTILDSLETRELVFRFPGNMTFVRYRWWCESKIIPIYKAAFKIYARLPSEIKKTVLYYHEDIILKTKEIELAELGKSDLHFIAENLADPPQISPPAFSLNDFDQNPPLKPRKPLQS